MWILGIIGFILLILRKEPRKGILSLMMFQSIIWLFNMFVFKYGLISAPVRELPKAHDFPLTLDYFFHPLLFSIFYIYKRGIVIPFLVWVSAATTLDIVLEQYTDLLEFGKMTWFGLYMYFAFIYFVSLLFCNWFYKDKKLFQADRWETQ
ncbi:CBO0543 family protein [Fredinandcohnia sp. 179-A 10B2 NHS]|uniref:CBO0543 family protein n=1 Tax=Fredinandcohnia sp. 179-A 10B2 NHS TaxID=3235176 RepID=UPI0039A3DB5A